MTADQDHPTEDAIAAQAPSAWSVLCVDDEPNILAALKRALRPEGCRVLTAQSGAEALALMEDDPTDVVVSDMRMPGMDGATLLAKIRQRWPETERILLTGYSDMAETVAAINGGQIYRYIHKPWDDLEVRIAVRQAAERRALGRERTRLEVLTRQQNVALQALNAELEAKVQARTLDLAQANEQLKRNYLTSIKIFANLMELRHGVGAGHGKRTGDLARRTAAAMGCSAEQTQDILVAGLLHDVGFMALPDHVLDKPVGRLAPDELKLYKRHPVVGAQAFMALDAHQEVADYIRSHHERFDGAGFPDGLAGADVPLGARILAVASSYDDLLRGHLTGGQLTDTEAQTLMLRGRGGQFDPDVLDAFLNVLQAGRERTPAPPSLDTDHLQPGMVLSKDLLSKEGVLLLSAGQALTRETIWRIQRYEVLENTTIKIEIQQDKPTPLHQGLA